MAERQTRVISMYDPAIDWVATSAENAHRWLRNDREAWKASDDGKRPALLTLRPNTQPTVYTLRVIPHEVAAGFIMDQPSIASRYVAAFRAALVRVENGIGADGQLIASWAPRAVREARRSLARVSSLLDDDEMQMFDGIVIQDIGAAAWSSYAFFLRGTVVSWQLPESWQQTWEAVLAKSLAAPGESTATDGTPKTPPAPPPAEG